MKLSKDGKITNITIRVTEEMKEKAEHLWKEKYFALPFNAFLAHLINVGIQEEEMWLEIEKQRREKLKNDVLLKTAYPEPENYKNEEDTPDSIQKVNLIHDQARA